MDFYDSYRPPPHARSSQTFQRDDPRPNSSPSPRRRRRSVETDGRDCHPWKPNGTVEESYDPWRPYGERRYESSPQRRPRYHNDWHHDEEPEFHHSARFRRSQSPLPSIYRPLTPSTGGKSLQAAFASPSITTSSHMTPPTVTHNGVRDVPTAPTAILRARREPHIFIPSTSVPSDPEKIPLLSKYMQKYHPTRILVDDSGYYILFEDSQLGRMNLHTCHDQLNMRAFLDLHVLQMRKYSNDRPNPEPLPLASPDAAEAIPHQRDALGLSEAQKAMANTASANSKEAAPGSTRGATMNPVVGPTVASNTADLATTPIDSPGRQPLPQDPVLDQDRAASLPARPHTLAASIAPSASLPATAGTPLPQDLDDTSSLGGKTAPSNISASQSKKCHVCEKPTDPERMVQCRACPRRYHRQCHIWYSIPVGADEKKTWRCHRCVTKSDPKGSIQGPVVPARAASLQDPPLKTHGKRLSTVLLAEDVDPGLVKKRKLQRADFGAVADESPTASRPAEAGDELGVTGPATSLASKKKKPAFQTKPSLSASAGQERLMKPGRRSSVEDPIIEDLFLDAALEDMEAGRTGEHVQSKHSVPGSRPAFVRTKRSQSKTLRSTLTAGDPPVMLPTTSKSGPKVLHQDNTGGTHNVQCALGPPAAQRTPDGAANRSSYHTKQPLENASTSAASNTSAPFHRASSTNDLDAHAAELDTIAPNTVHPSESNVAPQKAIPKAKAKRTKVFFNPCAECGHELPRLHPSKFCMTCETSITAADGADEPDQKASVGALAQDAVVEHQPVLQQGPTTAILSSNSGPDIPAEKVSLENVNSVREHTDTTTSATESSITVPSKENPVEPKCGDLTKKSAIVWADICLMAMSDARGYSVSRHDVCEWLAENIPRHPIPKDNWPGSASATLSAWRDKLWTRTTEDGHARYTLNEDLRGKVVRWDHELGQPVSPLTHRRPQDDIPAERVKQASIRVEGNRQSLVTPAVNDSNTHKGTRQASRRRSTSGSRENSAGVDVADNAPPVLASAQVRVPSPPAVPKEAGSTDTDMPDAPAPAIQHAPLIQQPPPATNADIPQSSHASPHDSSSDDEPIRRGTKRGKLDAGAIPQAVMVASTAQTPRMNDSSVRKNELVESCTKLKWNMEHPYLKAILSGSTKGICHFTRLVKSASPSYSQDYLMLNLSRYVLFRIANITAEGTKTLSRCNMDAEIVLYAIKAQEGQALSPRAQRQWESFGMAGDQRFRVDGDPISKEDVEAAEARFDRAIRVTEDHTLLAYPVDDPDLPEMPLSRAKIVRTRGRIAVEPMTPGMTNRNVQHKPSADPETAHVCARFTSPPGVATREPIATHACQTTTNGRRDSGIESTNHEKSADQPQLPRSERHATEKAKGTPSTTAKGTWIEELSRAEAQNCEYSVRDFFEEYPEYRREEMEKRLAQQERMAARLSRKQLFKMPATYSLLADVKDEDHKLGKLARETARSVGSRAGQSRSQAPTTPRKSNFNPLLAGTEMDVETRFDTLDEFLDLPDNPLPIISKPGTGRDSQLAYRDGTTNADGELPRARAVYRVGPAMK